MHPTAARELPADQGAWAFEPKWDGCGALGHVVGGGLALRSRNGVDMAGWFPELGGLAGTLGEHAGVLDGEVVAFDPGGRPSFEALQQRMASRVGRRRGAAVTYLVFDLLWLDGRLLTGLPYAERRRLLEDLEVAGPADPELAQDQALPARDVPGSAASSPTATRSARCSSACPTRTGRAGCASPAGSTTGWSRRPCSAGRWTRPGPDDPAPVFVRPELAVEVTFLGWESGRLRHPAWSGLSQLL
jgi:ATP-dependent DNA ligase